MAKRSKKSSTASTPQGSKPDPEEAGAWLYHEAARRGLDVEWMTRPTAYGIIRRLKMGKRPMDVAKEMKLPLFKIVPPSDRQLGYIRSLGLPVERCLSKHHAGMILDAHLAPLKVYSAILRQIDKAVSEEMLDIAGLELRITEGVLRADWYAMLVEEGRKRRQEIEDKKNGEAF